jgi:hypothetical protein
MAKELIPVRVTLKLDPRVNRKMEDVIKRMVPPTTKQRFIQDAVIKRLAEDWRGV